MLDLKFLRTETEFVKKALLKRMDVVDFDAIFELDDRRRSLIAEGDSMRSKKKSLAQQIVAESLEVFAERGRHPYEALGVSDCSWIL